MRLFHLRLAAAGAALVVAAASVAGTGQAAVLSPGDTALPSPSPDPARGPAIRMSYAPRALPPAVRPSPKVRIDKVLVARTAAASTATPPLAVRGADGGLWVFHQGFGSYGGRIVGDPAAVLEPASGGSARALYVVTGNDGNLWIRDDFRAFQPLTPASTRCTGGPAVVVVPDGAGPGQDLLAAACRGLDGGLWVASAAVSSWPAPLPRMGPMGGQGGVLEGMGVAAALQRGAATFFGTGMDSHVWTTAPGVRAWAQLPPQCWGPPSAGGDSSGLTVACVALDGSPQYSRFNSGGWSAPASAGGCAQEMVAVRPLSGAVAVDVEGCDGGTWENQADSGGVGTWVAYGGRIGTTSQPGYQLPVPVMAQVMPLDCETASLQMGLAYLGSNYLQQDLFPLESPDTRPAQWINGVLHWGDEFTNFVGNVYGSERDYTGNGVYYPPILSIAQTHGAPGSVGGQGYQPLDIYKAVAEGHPVIAWVEFQWARPPIGTWIAWDGRPINYTTWEHTVTVRGVSATQVLVNDPHPGNTYWIDRSTFEASMRDFGNMAVIVR